MNDVMTVAGLAVFSVAVGIVLLVTQYLKAVLPKINARWIALATAFIYMMILTFANGGNLTAYAIAIINAFLIASSAMGAYETALVKKLFADKPTGGEDKIE